MKLDRLGFKYHVGTGLFSRINYSFEPILTNIKETEQVIETIRKDFASIEEIFDRILLPLNMKKKSAGAIEDDRLSSGFDYSGDIGVFKKFSSSQSIEYTLHTYGTGISRVAIKAYTGEVREGHDAMLAIYDSIQNLPLLTFDPMTMVAKNKIDLLRKGGKLDPRELPSKLLI